MLATLGGGIILIAVAVIATMLAFAWRRIVPTNMVHVVQYKKKTIAFGAGLSAGNIYYEVPSFIPVFGVTVTKLPVSNFEVPMDAYPAYDKDRVPFELDLMAFLRISDPVIAAQRINTFSDLKDQMFRVCESAVRAVLGAHDIHEIMLKRTTLGEAFTNEIKEELQSWGVEAVKNIALNDVRDINGSKEGPIHRIMAEKTSEIEAQSRRKVAEQKRVAQEAEIANQQSVDIRAQEAKQLVGEREAQQVQAVGIAQEKAKQATAEQAAETKRKDMEVVSVETQRKAEIAKAAAIVKADQDKQTAVITAEAAKQVAIVRAEGDKQQQVITAEGQKTNLTLIAEGNLQTALREAEGIEAKGKAQGAAETAIAMAPVTANLALAKEIGSNEGYQTYLVSIRNVEKDEAIGVAYAGAVEKADLKVIANGGSIQGGVQSLGDLFSSKGGVALGSALEGFAATEEGQRLLSTLIPAATKANGAASKKAAN